MAKNKNYCVYVLSLNNTPIYVGMTSNIKIRLKQHLRGEKNFNSYIVLEYFEKKKDALTFEKGIIKYLSVFQSKTITNGLYQSLTAYSIYL